MPDKRNRSGYHAEWHAKNREKINKRHREMYALHREERLAKCRERYQNNKEVYRLRHAEYRRTHPEQAKNWREKNKDHSRQYRAENREKIQQQTIAWNKRQRARLFEMYGHKCSCPCGCSESFEPLLTLGHLLNDGAVDRAKNGGYHGVLKKALAKYDPEHYGILCWNCNNGANANGGICPKIKVR